MVAADLNVLPTAIIDRIEVLKSGASSVYGSDAVAGVVNIITDKALTGLQLDLQTNVPAVGAGVDRRASASFGMQTDRLGIIGSLEYRKRNALARGDVPFFNCPIGGFLDGEGSAFGSGDPFPVGDPRNCFTLDNGGTTINTLGLPTRQAIGRTSGVLGNFNRFVPAPGVTTGRSRLSRRRQLRSRHVRSRDAARTARHRRRNLHRLSVGDLQAAVAGQRRNLRRTARTRRKSGSPLYRQLSLDYLQGSPLLPANIRNGAFANPTNTSSGRSSRRAPSSASA